jgi:hypothetical protein
MTTLEKARAIGATIDTPRKALDVLKPARESLVRAVTLLESLGLFAKVTGVHAANARLLTQRIQYVRGVQRQIPTDTSDLPRHVANKVGLAVLQARDALRHVERTVADDRAIGPVRDLADGLERVVAAIARTTARTATAAAAASFPWGPIAIGALWWYHTRRR